MSTTFYRFPDKSTFDAIASQDEYGNYLVPNLDLLPYPLLIGGQWDEDGNQTEAPTEVAGYHVNTPEPVPELEQYRIDRPNSPYRVFAGD